MSDPRTVQCPTCGKQEAHAGISHVVCKNLDCGAVTTLGRAADFQTRCKTDLERWARKISPVPAALYAGVMSLYEAEYRRINREIAVLKETPK